MQYNDSAAKTSPKLDQVWRIKPIASSSVACFREKQKKTNFYFNRCSSVKQAEELA